MSDCVTRDRFMRFDRESVLERGNWFRGGSYRHSINLHDADILNVLSFDCDIGESGLATDQASRKEYRQISEVKLSFHFYSSLGLSESCDGDLQGLVL